MFEANENFGAEKDAGVKKSDLSELIKNVSCFVKNYDNRAKCIFGKDASYENMELRYLQHLIF